MPCDDNNPDLPCLDAMVAGTVALMTAWAQLAPDASPPSCRLRSLQARKIVSNLFFLQHHPHASPGLRQVMAHAHSRWVDVAGTAADPEHPTPPVAPAIPASRLH